MSEPPNNRLMSFLLWSRCISAVLAVMYHVRFLLFVDYDGVLAKTVFTRLFYFVTGLGHEAFAIFFVVDGIVAGTLLLHVRQQSVRAVVPFLRGLADTYIVLLPGLILGASLDLMGVQLFNHSGLYTNYPAFSTVTLTLGSFAGNLFMLEPFFVPTFGSNGMLYLFSYLCWSFILLMAAVAAAGLKKPFAVWAQLALVAAVLLFVPSRFLIWMAIWLLGVAVAFLRQAGIGKLPITAAATLMVTTLVLSRLIGSNQNLLPQPYGCLVLFFKYLAVGFSFAVLAHAIFPSCSFPQACATSAPSTMGPYRLRGDDATFTFFFHFPIVMLIAGIGADLLGEHLMQQPEAVVYALFFANVAATYCLTALAACAIRRAIAWLGPPLRP